VSNGVCLRGEAGGVLSLTVDSGLVGAVTDVASGAVEVISLGPHNVAAKPPTTPGPPTVAGPATRPGREFTKPKRI